MIQHLKKRVKNCFFFSMTLNALVSKSLVTFKMILFYMHIPNLQQARSQELFRATKLSWNLDTSINIHRQHEKERSRKDKNFRFFCLETLKKFILNEKFYPQMTTISVFFSPNQGTQGKLGQTFLTEFSVPRKRRKSLKKHSGVRLVYFITFSEINFHQLNNSFLGT